VATHLRPGGLAHTADAVGSSGAQWRGPTEKIKGPSSLSSGKACKERTLTLDRPRFFAETIPVILLLAADDSA